MVFKYVRFPGILTNIALKKFTPRQVGIFGAVVYTLSWFLNVFVTQLYQMIITAGIMSVSNFMIFTSRMAILFFFILFNSRFNN